MSCFIAMLYLDYKKSCGKQNHTIMKGRMVLVVKALASSMNPADKTAGKLGEIQRIHVV